MAPAADLVGLLQSCGAIHEAQKHIVPRARRVRRCEPHLARQTAVVYDVSDGPKRAGVDLADKGPCQKQGHESDDRKRDKAE